MYEVTVQELERVMILRDKIEHWIKNRGTNEVMDDMQWLASNLHKAYDKIEKQAEQINEMKQAAKNA